MLLVASTGPVLVRCWQHRPSTGPVLAHNGMFMGIFQNYVLLYLQATDFLIFFFSLSICIFWNKIVLFHFTSLSYLNDSYQIYKEEWPAPQIHSFHEPGSRDWNHRLQQSANGRRWVQGVRHDVISRALYRHDRRRNHILIMPIYISITHGYFDLTTMLSKTTELASLNAMTL